VRHKFGILAICLFLAACSGVQSPSGGGGQPGSASLTGILVSPASASVAAAATVNLHATGTYSDGTSKDITTSVTWLSSDSTVASVSNAGVATGVATGVVTVSAHSGAFSASATLTVGSAGTNLTSITLSPVNASIPINTTLQLTATGNYSDGSTRDLTALVSWSSAAISKATVDVAGLVQAGAAGTSSITATLGSVSQSTNVTVTAPTINSISVTPEDLTLPIGISQQYIASAIYSDGSIEDLVSGVTWSSSTTSVATIDANGLATIIAAGSTTITATVGAFTDTTTITVVPAHLTSITLSPASVSIAPGTRQQFVATGNFDDGSTQVLTSALWSSSAISVLTMDASGLGVAVGPGTSTVTAISGTISATASVTVTNATLVSLAIAPLASSMPAGAVKQFTATGTFSDNSSEDMTNSVLWSSSDASIATIDNSGIATSIAVGSTTITAEWGAITQSTTLTVSNVTLVSITISPANPRLEVHTSLKFTATGNYSDGSTSTLANVSWRSSKNNFANVRGSGILHAKKAGNLTLSASSSGITGTTTVIIGTGTLVSVAITPANSSVTAGSTQQMAAIGTFSDGTTQDVTINSHWSSTVPTVATIANAPVNAGLARTFAAGTTTIGVNRGGNTASTTLTAN
jgi:trimeric autotransporter adhesin